MPHRALAVEATRAALRLRVDLGIPLGAPVCPFDVAERAGMRVRFQALSSVEALYSKSNKTAVVNTNRPHGRRAHNCAHELGHHLFGHGSQVEELIEHRARANRLGGRAKPAM